jgi:hypothetical protein
MRVKYVDWLHIYFYFILFFFVRQYKQIKLKHLSTENVLIMVNTRLILYITTCHMQEYQMITLSL